MENLEMKISALKMLFNDHQQNARHHEIQRATVTNFVILVGGAIATLVINDGLKSSDLPLTILIILLGLFGAVFSASNLSRYYRQKTRAYAFRDKIDQLLFPAELILSTIKKDADDQAEEKHPFLKFTLAVHLLWAIFPLIVSLLGLALTLMVFQSAERS